MIPAPVHPNEKERVAALKSYGLLDTPAEQQFDAVTKLASAICNAPISLITLVDENRQWFKSAYGTDVKETPREYSFCTHAMADEKPLLVVEDLRKDERFSTHPFVTGDPRVVFYAGAPVITEDGFPIGAHCVLAREERHLNRFQMEALQTLAGQVGQLVEGRRRVKNLQTFQRLLEERNRELEKMVTILMKTEPTIAALSGSITALRSIESLKLQAEARGAITDSSQLLATILAAFERVKAMS